MCSIFGHINYKNNLFDKNFFIEASDLMKSRGPDTNSYLSDNSVYQFAFNRLAIQDLNSTGNQPMISSCGRYLCVFNGEIYNFKNIYKEIGKHFIWRGSSDTEVLLNAWSIWQEEAFNKIDGMFAFAIWDLLKQKLILGRDRIGEKPLYYSLNNESIIFSSRPKSILKIYPNLKKEIDKESLEFYLSAGFFPRKKCFFSKINKLEPGTYLKFDEEGAAIKKYWDINNFNPSKINQNSINYNVAKCEELLKESIRDRLISDKPLGFFLSGGIDSSLIVSIASTILKKENIKVFNLGFDDNQFDESKDAQLVANHLDIKLNKKKLDPKELILLFPKFYENFDEPFADSACFPLMAISEFAKKYVDVVITGDGGDELFGGYSYYSTIDYFNKFNRSLTFLGKIIPFSFFSKYLKNNKIELLSKLFEHDGFISKFSFMRSARKDFPNIFINSSSDKFDINNVFNKYAKKMPLNNSPVDKSMKLDILTTLNDNYLQKSDLSTMAYSLECRSPFLSKKIIEWSQTLQTNQKVNFFYKKIILKKLAKKYLPDEIVNKKKRGFELPIKNWLRSDLKEWAENLICEEKNYKNLPFKKEKVLNLLKLHLSKKRDCHSYLWTILMVLKYNENHLTK
jgi:asparagine synthase (glutamine-hydrolysing)